MLVVFSLLLSATGLGIVGLQLLNPRQAGSGPQVARVEAPPVVAPAPRIRMLVAARPLSIGTLLKDDDFREQEVTAEMVPEGAFTNGAESRAELRGALLRRFIDPNQPVVTTDVLRPRDRGFLAAVLRPGTRAISIGVDVVTGASGLIWPGDEVDLILTQNLQQQQQRGQQNDPGRRVVGETILSGVRVIAVDQQISHTAAETSVARVVARTVTIEVSPEQAERVAVAMQLGRISLVVRSIEGVPEARDPRPSLVFGSDVSSALTGAPQQAPGARMRVIQGGSQQEVTFR
ncbi:Flp pilus assembly protein CpaB [Roseomonas sp. HF4]|uniref:Flp pilus assembly protein CpaB n=1 Tax=Roseomonas sp. HF4 TaxID=2562313 RepID=UPI001484F100|nr:Flp pilus assembly protein CpaB [Roseomonas sp. HF4]